MLVLNRIVDRLPVLNRGAGRMPWERENPDSRVGEGGMVTLTKVSDDPENEEVGERFLLG